MTPEQIRELVDAARRVQGTFGIRDDGFTAASVGSALRSRGGRTYTGVCVDLACGLGFCAEQGAIAEMLKSRETEIAAIVAVNADAVVPPCGRCRELILQLSPANAKTLVVVAPDRTVSLAELLPQHWLPQ